MKVTPADRRQLDLLRTSLTVAAPVDPKEAEEVTRLLAGMEGAYGRGKYCPSGAQGEDCLDIEEITELRRRVITLAFSELVLETGLGAIDLQGRQVELSAKLRDFVAERVDDEYGLAIPDITMNISLPDEITAAMTRGVARGVEEGGFLENVGDLGRYQQAKQADAMLAAAQNPGGGGTMGDMMGMGMGMAMAGQMANQMQNVGQQQAPAGPPP